MIEYILSSDPAGEALSFIFKNYPVNQEDVDAVITEAEKNRLVLGKKGNETQYLSPISYLMTKVYFPAEGRADEVKFPLNHVPTMIAAAKQMETSVPEEKKLMTTLKSIELLLSFELTLAQKSANPLYAFKETKEHTEKAMKLSEFREALLK